MFAGPGGWTDPGYLAVGMGLSVAESRSQFGIWAIMKSILLVDADLSKLGGSPTNATNPWLAILKNEELIAINQDSLGFVGRIVNSSTGFEPQMHSPVAPVAKAMQQQQRGSPHVGSRVQDLMARPARPQLLMSDYFQLCSACSSLSHKCGVPSPGFNLTFLYILSSI